MPTEVFRGRYTDEGVILGQLKNFFTAGVVQVMFERSRFYCIVPHALTEDQRRSVLDAVEADHYARDT